MKKVILIDNRMRDFEKQYFKNIGYTVIEIPTNDVVYSEISSHVDIFCTKINDKIFLEPTVYNYLKEYNCNIDNLECGVSFVKKEYPFDIPYNVCQIGENVIHNFKYTDKQVLEYVSKIGLNKININQGYSNCSIAVISENCAIVTDKNIAEILKTNNIKVLLLEEEIDIKLLNKKKEYSKMNGFIGGCISRVDDKIIVFGDLDKLKEGKKIRDFIQNENLEIIEFKGHDLIDYGGVIR